ncbi:MOSC domain-containing protein [Rhizobium halophytocola]|uniref:Uncharacterized protein YcbX n=1 Tax=Rhizobium halophytocola TaxID=735519 RepID=A0ABS4E5L8_9HYPH|nr:MOSC domain-containing protein [Rhizobium halophytocola]MBP1853241.1 uncharacterized protein YcbX [Rhizobium halophytocola]
MQLDGIGKVLEVWRYPVSSLAGERCETISVSPAGIAGDRRFGLFDQRTGLSAAPEQEPRWRPALFLSATLGEETLPQIWFPDEGPFWLDDSTLQQRLTGYFGFPVAVGAYGGMEDHADYRFPVISNRYTPEHLHLVTTTSLAHLAAIGAFAELDARRFRPSVLIETQGEGEFVENAWIGKDLRLGAMQVTVTEPTKRCGMTLVAQPEIGEEPNVLRNILRHNKRNFGAYARVSEPGEIAVGDRVTQLAASMLTA